METRPTFGSAFRDLGDQFTVGRVDDLKIETKAGNWEKEYQTGQTKRERKRSRREEKEGKGKTRTLDVDWVGCSWHHSVGRHEKKICQYAIETIICISQPKTEFTAFLEDTAFSSRNSHQWSFPQNHLGTFHR